MTPVSVSVTRRGAERFKAGHPWIYAADVATRPSGLVGGEIVRVVDHRGRFLGQAFYSAESKIVLRWLSWDEDTIEVATFRERLHRAQALRQAAYPEENAYRVVHGEADLLPGLVVDRFGDFLSVQFLHKGSDSRKEMWAELLQELFQPKAIINRSDTPVRHHEGLEPEKGVLRGHAPGPISYREGRLELEVDLLSGQKTGAFLDQRDNHVMAAQYGAGEALDCFSYAGGFALQLAQRADRVTAVEISPQACAAIERNATRNGIQNLTVAAENAFDFLRRAVERGDRYDTIVLDPPSFAKAKGAIEAAVRGYKEINLRAMQLLRPGGTLISASCTYHVDETRFETMLDDAAADARRRVQILEKRGAGKDHPVLLGLRETRYLKCFVLRVL